MCKKGTKMKFSLTILFFAFMSNAIANESCLFPPCPPPPTNSEIKAADNVFKKTKYILGAAFDVQNSNDGKKYKNIPDFVSKTKALKSDIKLLGKLAKNLHAELGGFQLQIAISNIEQCISFNQSAIQYCSQALTELKNYHWEQAFGTSWSGYPVTKNWAGFPKSLK